MVELDPASSASNGDKEARQKLTADYPYVALYPQTTNIHPSTGRLVTLDGVAFNDAGEVGEEFHEVFNVGGDPGPRHMHGVEPGVFERAPRFSRHLKALDRFIDGRTLVVHDAPLAWGFVVSESRRAMNAAARANRSRGRKQGRRRQRVGHVPQPVAIVDTLASARHQGAVIVDSRLEAVANLAGINAPAAAATAERAGRPEAETSRERTLLLVELYLAQRETGAMISRTPDELAADRFGLQRSRIRVEAEKTEPRQGNPGHYTSASGLRPGMEVVVTDDINVSHDELVQAIMDADMTYAEKLTRETSLVVTNADPARPEDLRGKAMHAERKNIPLLDCESFLAALRSAEATKATADRS